ncbi:MAG: DUF1549 and DUF1553 domain-containing protein, partial [Planctomycetaceae bacterium]
MMYTRRFHPTLFFRVVAVFSVFTMAADDAASDTRLVVYPDVVRLRGRDAQQQVLVTRVGPQFSRDVTRQAVYTVTQPDLVDVSEAGVVTARSSGQLQLTISVDGLTRMLPIEVQDGARWLPLDFAQDIVPVLTKRHCNGGGCHGKSTGQGGFHLSLYGYNPSADYHWITRDSTGRRIQPLQPVQSLLLLKPTQSVPHGGGRRLTVGEPEYQRLARWIGRGAPSSLTHQRETEADTTAPAPALDRVALYPPQRALRSGHRQQLVATAIYTDGSRRDVTRLTQFRSNESTIAEVDEWGLVTAGERQGETAIVGLYAGQVAVSRVQRPLEHDWQTPAMPVRNRIDTLLLERLAELRIPPSDVCDDETFLRRATQQITGRIPTLAELTDFRRSAAANKRTEAIDRLLDDPGYADHFAQKWSAILRNKRRGQSPRIPGTIAFHRWIRNAVAGNLPYDRFVREILTATGNVESNPPAQWYAEVRYLERYVDDTAQLFLGTRIACARCHHHPFENISQRDYYGLDAFFARVDRKGGSGVAERRANEAIFVKPTGEVKHPLTGQAVPPHGLGGPELVIAAFDDPRRHLVDWMTQPDNPYFARAFANRMWAHFFGKGLVTPLDDLRVTNPASNEPLLDWLARQFIEHNFDMRFLIRTICTSSTYQLSTDPNDHNLDETQNFSRFYPQRLKAEVLLDVLDQVSGAATAYSGLPAGTRAVQLPDEGYSNQFLKVFGRPPRESACECERIASPSLSQSLLV